MRIRVNGHNQRIRAALIAKKEKAVYADLAREHGVNPYYLWEIINTPGYQPPAKPAAKLGWQRFETVSCCDKCGEAPKICLCDGARVVKPSKRKAKRYPRAQFSKSTPVEKIIKDLKRVTGKDFVLKEKAHE